MAAAADKPTIFYWGIKARAHIPVMILTAGEVDFNWEKNVGDYKSFAPFGQLPVLKVCLLFPFRITNQRYVHW
jgi:hypothetical protein